MAEACRSFNISRKTGYKWLRRYEKDGDSGLADQSRRPVNQATKLSEKVLLRIVGIRIAHKHWGADKIRAILKREHVFFCGEYYCLALLNCTIKEWSTAERRIHEL